MAIRLLHTSDWHLGRSLVNKRRLVEQEAILHWLLEEIRTRHIDILVIAGDVFDSSTPGTGAQKVYYSFLRSLLATTCRHVVVIAGNHDSPSFLSAPGEILGMLGVHVVGAVSPDDACGGTGDTLPPEVLVLDLPAMEGQARSLVCCAVPYLRERDIRLVAAGESMESKDSKSLEGIRHHYTRLGAAAQKKRLELGPHTPLVVTGHLFAAGGRVIDGDGVRELAVGSLVAVPADIFPAEADYVALGHLHSPQIVDGKEHIRYCGAPLHCGFAEAKLEKSVCVVTFAGRTPVVEKVTVPVAQRLATVQGDLSTLREGLEALVAAGESVWVEAEYNGSELVGNLEELLYGLVDGSPVELLRIRNTSRADLARSLGEEHLSLKDMGPQEVFARCLRDGNVPDVQRPNLARLHDLVLAELMEEHAEPLPIVSADMAGNRAGQV